MQLSMLIYRLGSEASGSQRTPTLARVCVFRGVAIGKVMRKGLVVWLVDGLEYATVWVSTRRSKASSLASVGRERPRVTGPFKIHGTKLLETFFYRSDRQG